MGVGWAGLECLYAHWTRLMRISVPTKLQIGSVVRRFHGIVPYVSRR